MVFNSVIVSETAFNVGISCGVSDILVIIFKTDSLLQLVLTHLTTVLLLKRLVSPFYRFWNSHSMKKRKLEVTVLRYEPRQSELKAHVFSSDTLFSFVSFLRVVDATVHKNEEVWG